MRLLSEVGFFEGFGDNAGIHAKEGYGSLCLLPPLEVGGLLYGKGFQLMLDFLCLKTLCTLIGDEGFGRSGDGL